MATNAPQLHIPFTLERQERFLLLIADAHSVTHAATICGVHRSTVYDHYQVDMDFHKRFDEAIKARGDFWEERLRDLGALKGKPDTLAVIIGLKKEGRFVEPQYRQAVQVNVQIDNRPYQHLSMEELRQRLAEARAKAIQHELEARIIDVKALPESLPEGEARR